MSTLQQLALSRNGKRLVVGQPGDDGYVDQDYDGDDSITGGVWIMSHKPTASYKK